MLCPDDKPTMFGPNTSTTTLGDHLVSHHKEAVDKRKLLVKEAKVNNMLLRYARFTALF
jgi:hypothetical protein